MFKKVFIVMVCFVLALSTFGCSSGGGKSSSGSSLTSSSEVSDPFAPTSKIIKVSWYTPWWIESTENDFIFDEFARKYPGYTIVKEELRELPDLLSAIQAGTQPDVWMGGDPNQTNFTSGCYQDLFSSLDDYLAKDPVLNKNTLAASQMELSNFFGHFYALPYQTSQFCIVYNKKLFSQAGIDPEKPPVTWTEFYEYAKKLTKFDSNGVLTQMGVIDGPWQYQLENLKKSGGSLQDNGVDSNMNSSWMLEVNEYADKFSKLTGSDSAKPKDVQFTMENGNAAMTVNGNLSYLNSYAQAGIDFGIAKLPRPDDYDQQIIPTLLWYYLTIPQGAKNPNGGWLFAKFAMTDGLYQSIAKDYQKNPSGLFPQYIAHQPTREKVYNTFLQNLSTKTADLVKKRDLLVTDNTYIMPFSPIHSTLIAIENKWSEKQNAGTVGLKERLEGVHQEYQAQLSTWKKDMIAKGWAFPEGQKPIPPTK